MRKYMTVILLASFLFAVGCAETPSEVQNEISILDNNSINHDESSNTTDTGEALQFGTLEEIRSDAEAVLTDGKGNFQIESLLLPDTEQMHAYSLERTHNDALQSWLFDIYDDFYDEPLAKDTEEIEEFEDTDYLTNYDGFDLSEYNLSSYVHNFSKITHLNNEPVSSLTVGVYDHISFYRCFDMVTSPYLLTNIPEVQTYRFDAWEGVSYPMYEGGEWLISDAAAYAEAFYNQINIDEQFSYQVESVTVRKIEDATEEAYGYWFLLKRVAEDGVEVYPIYNRNDSGINSICDMVCTELHWAWCIRPNEICELEKMEDYTVIDRTAAESLLTLSQAKKIAEGIMASGRVYHVDCRLAYCVRLYGSVVSETIGETFSEAVQYGDYTELRMEPYWIFTEVNSEGREVRYLVNAQTGAFEIR